MLWVHTLPKRSAAPLFAISGKIAQDVLVFKKIASLMPPQSLLHLLRADVLVSVDPGPSEVSINQEDEIATATAAPVIDAQNHQAEKIQPCHFWLRTVPPEFALYAMVMGKC